MTVQERLNEISQLSGLSVEMVRRVLNAEAESLAESVKKGERATLIGRCTMVPYISTKIDHNGKVVKTIKLSSKVSDSFKNRVSGLSEFQKEDTEEEDLMEKFRKDNPGIRTVQINGLL